MKDPQISESLSVLLLQKQVQNQLNFFMEKEKSSRFNSRPGSRQSIQLPYLKQEKGKQLSYMEQIFQRQRTKKTIIPERRLSSRGGNPPQTQQILNTSGSKALQKNISNQLDSLSQLQNEYSVPNGQKQGSLRNSRVKTNSIIYSNFVESQQLTDQKKWFEVPLLKICQNANIPRRRFEECKRLFEANEIEELIDEAEDSDREYLKKQLEKLKGQKGGNTDSIIKDKLIKMWEDYGINAQKVDQYVDLLNSKQHELILKKLPKGLRSAFQQIIEGAGKQEDPKKFQSPSAFRGRILPVKSKISTLQDVFKECEIDSRYYRRYAQNLEKGSYNFLLEISEEKRKKVLKFLEKKQLRLESDTLQKTLKLALSSLLEDKEIEHIINMMKTKGTEPRDLDQIVIDIINEAKLKFASIIELVYEEKTKRIKMNELYLYNKSIILQKEIQRITYRDLDDLVFFYDEGQITIEKLNIELHKTYKIQAFESRKYDITFNKRNYQVDLIPGKNMNYNKKIIFMKIIKVVMEENQENNDEPFDLMRMTVKAEHKNTHSVIENEMTLTQIEKQQKIRLLNLQVKMKIILFYEDKKDELDLNNTSTILQLRQMLNDKYVPLESQVLALIDGNNIKELDFNSAINNKTMGEISSNRFTLSFELRTKIQLQFYGFQHNYPFSFENFGEFTVDSVEDIVKIIQSCQFNEKNEAQYKKESERFIRKFIQSVFSGIKKRFSIQTILNLYKKLVTTHKFVSIWTPNSSDGALKVNQSFVLAYLLQNSDERLKIEVMNLVRENTPLPLYRRGFDDIFKVDQDVKLTEQMMWIMSKGYTVTSFGLYSAKSSQEEMGKSSLLNNIFPTHFLENKNKHPILQGIPYIAIRVLQSIYPLHIIDIPRDCPEEVEKSIFSVSNMIILHSWKTEQETQSYLREIKAKYQIPIICLMRDCSGTDTLKNLKDQWIRKEKPLKLINIKNKERCEAEIHLLKNCVYDFIQISGQKKENQILNIYGLFKKHKHYPNYQYLTKLVEDLKVDFLTLCKFGPVMEEINAEEIIGKADIVNQRKQSMKDALHPKIYNLVEFLSSQNARPIRYMLLKILREQIRIIQIQFNLKYQKAYEIKDSLALIQGNCHGMKKLEKMQKLDEQIIKLKQLGGKSIKNLNNDQISHLLEEMIANYNNKVKPTIFSMELFWRQLNYQAKINENYQIGKYGQKQSLVNAINDLKQTEITANLPFELIDGDLLEFPLALMKGIFERRQQRVIVISVLGPQSSGKSTLLNFIFGCDFATSEGRCTRGIYGTLYKFSENKGVFNDISNCDGIFVIDTEGLFAITDDKDKQNQNRSNFDSKLILFCLAVSEFVVLNVRGNLDNKTEKILKICHQRIDNLNTTQKKRPQIVIVLNQNASDKKEESQNEFREIRKTIEFQISKSLSLAYELKNYKQEQICLLSKKQNLTKKYPKESFLKETSDLMNEIVNKIGKKKEAQKLCDLIIRFETIWGLVIAFPNLSKNVSDEYRQLQILIKNWKKKYQYEESENIQIMYEKFRENKMNQMKILETLEEHKNLLISQYEKEFKERFIDEEEIKLLKRQERDRIISKALVMKENVQHKLQSIKEEIRIRIAKIEGDKELNEKAKQIAVSKKENTEAEIRKVFDQIFSQILKKIIEKLDNTKQIQEEYFSIKHNYHFLLIDLTKNEMGLPNETVWIGDKDCEINLMDQTTRYQILLPQEQRFQDIMVHTHIHTNVLKGGKTDASLEYFNMKDYFNYENVQENLVITQSAMKFSLKKQIIKQQYKRKIQQMQKNGLKKDIIRSIFDNINESLEKICINLTDFQEFVKLYELKERNSVFHYFFGGQKEVQFQILPNTAKMVIHKSHKFSRFLNQYAERNYYHQSSCLCNFNFKDSKSYLEKRLYNHIDWDKIVLQVTKTDNYYNQLKKVNEEVTKSINEDIKKLNLKLKNEIDWRLELQNYPESYSQIQFQLLEERKLIESEELAIREASYTSYVNSRQFKRGIKFEEQPKKLGYNDLRIFVIKNKKLKPNEKNEYFKGYLKDNTKLTIQKMNQPEFKHFIFEQLTKKRRTFDQLYDRIIIIVDNVLSPQGKLQKNTLVQIYNGVSKEISKLNNDLNQVSCNLSDKYIGFVHLSVVYMIWKRVIDKKVKENLKIYEDKKKDEEKQWEKFKLNSSKDENKNVLGQINYLFEEITRIIAEDLKGKRQNIMNKEKIRFAKENSRDMIQKHLDLDIFRQDTPKETILEYIQEPKKAIEKKYEECYQHSWNSVQNIFSEEKSWPELMAEFYRILDNCLGTINDHQINQDMNSIEDFFSIIGNQHNTEGQQDIKSNYQKEGKKVMFCYLIDILLSDDPMKTRKCAGIEIKPIYDLKIAVNIKDNLKGLLRKLKQLNTFSVTNLAKYLKKIVEKSTKDKVNKDIAGLMTLSQKHRLEYLSMIKVLICPEMCPCCGRICGFEGPHQYHMCKYGHQMRGFNGSYFDRNGVKEASVIRCEQLAETDDIKYNGNVTKWCQFKAYWNSKKHGDRWNFDDATLKNDKKQNKIRFEKAWLLAGPLYCAKHGLKYVDCNSPVSASNVHYIFAVDESASMRHEWINLLQSLRQTVAKIKLKDNGSNHHKLSIIKFNTSATLVCQNQIVSKVNLDIPYSSGGTSFESPFEMAAQIAAKYIKNTKMVFIFMTDGEDSYPIEGIKALKQLQINNPKMLNYVGIEFGGQADVMNTIAVELKGTTGVAYNPEELTDLFIKSIEIIEYKE